MPTQTYQNRRGQLELYFDHTAVEAWQRLTSDAPVSRIRATVRAGRDRMRETLLGALPLDLTGRRILDAGCGTGAMAQALAKRGADVVAVDLSAKLVDMARERIGSDVGSGRIDFTTGDMIALAQDRFDHVVAMDSLIHYQAADIVRILTRFSENTTTSVVFTFAPRTPALAAMHFVGGFFPRSDRAPAIEPVSENKLRRLIDAAPALADWQSGSSERITSGFYLSQALELNRR